MSFMLRALPLAATLLVTTALGAAPRASADPLADLMRMLPSGYSSDSCKPATSKVALAAVECQDNSVPDGPTYATYTLYRDYNGMYDAFTAGLKSPTWAPATCPGKQSSDPAAVLGSDGKQYGFIACGRGTGADWQAKDGAVAWTRNADHFLGVAYVGYQGQAYPASLFNWVRAQQIESDCAASGGKYTAWHGDAGIYYSNCCFQDHCDEYVDGTYQGRSPG
ncbi:MAG: hypothetical protein CK429_28045 [Mycobacterium sp.]|uniref:Serine/threonine protein kinase n=2 Tax=Mycobacterium gordonae TaxID=1778 RepID=A0A1X1V920_MYCGO|nr:hypothetical protein [Mycobacterium gordonae]PJE06032.1 MAG: hypothetical protein CK429_28045 [Mycobacterium sp.]MBX9982181.1 hypothetical protein [Mycobacterium gordonae]MCQ4361795.1 hypothetical protein [Mycobacterium gordonae]MCV7009277.1 hypothetical protein [Mycobacterium gordonae]ODR18931.1 hypothetical protein BHQ23_21290 [Mycobacterium gordonae]